MFFEVRNIIQCHSHIFPQFFFAPSRDYILNIFQFLRPTSFCRNLILFDDGTKATKDIIKKFNHKRKQKKTKGITFYLEN